MLSDNDLQELADYSSGFPVLSVFLNTEPSESGSDAYALRLRNMLKRVNLPDDNAAIENYFNHDYDRSGNGLVIYSCASQNFFRTYTLAVPVRDMHYTGNKPAIRPLVRLLHIYGYYGVILLDKQGSRLFSFHMGELQEQEGNFGEMIKRTKQGGASSVPGRKGGTTGQTRAFEETVERNMKDTVDFAQEFFKENHVRRILIGGTDDNVSQFKNLLPKSWQSLVLGTFPMPMTANHSEVLQKALQIGKEADRIYEENLVKKVLDNSAQGINAITGLEKTLDSINTARVQKLIVSDDLYVRGYICPKCNQLFGEQSDGQCTHCNNPAKQTEDIIDIAISQVIKLGGDVEVIRSNPFFEKVGNIGALLRY